MCPRQTSTPAKQSPEVFTMSFRSHKREKKRQKEEQRGNKRKAQLSFRAHGEAYLLPHGSRRFGITVSGTKGSSEALEFSSLLTVSSRLTSVDGGIGVAGMRTLGGVETTTGSG